MTKNAQKLEDRLQEIMDLKKQRDEIDAKLARLTGIELPNDNAPQTLPHGLTLMNEIAGVFEEKKSIMRILEVKKEIDRIHRVNVPRRNIQATMQYMVKRGILQKEKEYGKYSLKTLSVNIIN